MKVIFAELKEVRPGRHLFVREWCLGVEAGGDNSVTTTTDADRSSIQQEAQQEPDLQLVCLHGCCATEAQFHPLFRALDYLLMYGPSKLRIKCILFDMIGCGKSPVMTEWDAYSCIELQQDLGAIVEQFTVATVPLYFLSHSYGPNILVHWLNSDTAKRILSVENVQGFIFLGASIRVNDSHPLPDGGHVVFRLPVWILDLLQSLLTKNFLSRAIDSSNRELHEECSKANSSNDMFMVKAVYRQIKWATSEELIKAVRNKPVIHFHGVNDGILQIGWGQHLVNQLLPNTTEFVPMEEASHLVMLEKPAEIARKIFDFLVANNNNNLNQQQSE
ncbi:hypothetical protein ACA910_020131 [Epithemia clementina (nom. ined.)]